MLTVTGLHATGDDPLTPVLKRSRDIVDVPFSDIDEVQALPLELQAFRVKVSEQ